MRERKLAQLLPRGKKLLWVSTLAPWRREIVMSSARRSIGLILKFDDLARHEQRVAVVSALAPSLRGLKCLRGLKFHRVGAIGWLPAGFRSRAHLRERKYGVQPGRTGRSSWLQPALPLGGNGKWVARLVGLDARYGFNVYSRLEGTERRGRSLRWTGASVILLFLRRLKLLKGCASVCRCDPFPPVIPFRGN